MGDDMSDDLTALDLEVDEQDLLFSAYLDDELTADERRDFDARLRDDPDFAAAWHDFSNFMGAIQSLPFELAPDNFVDSVQAQIRVRSRNHFFSDDFEYSSRTPFEIVIVVMILVMAVTYLFMGVPADAGLRDANVPDDTPSLR